MATDVTDRLEEAIDEKLDEQFDAAEQPADPCKCDGEIEVKFNGVAPIEKTQAEYEHSHYNLIREKARSVKKLRAEWAELQELAKAAKKRYEAEQSDLDYMACRDPREQLAMPFDETAALNGATVTVHQQGEPAPATDEAWQKTPLADLGLSAKILEAMEVARVRTVGELADYTRQYMLTDIKGIGTRKAEEIEEALTKFWAEHPEYSAPVAEADEEFEDESDDAE